MTTYILIALLWLASGMWGSMFLWTRKDQYGSSLSVQLGDVLFHFWFGLFFGPLIIVFGVGFYYIGRLWRKMLGRDWNRRVIWRGEQ